MKRSQIIREAKKLVLNHGPSNVQEFCWEYVLQAASAEGWTEEEKEAVDAEAKIQAERVYVFLGF